MNPYDELAGFLERLERRLRDLEAEVQEWKRQVNNAAADIDRLEDRVRTLEYER